MAAVGIAVVIQLRLRLVDVRRPVCGAGLRRALLRRTIGMTFRLPFRLTLVTLARRPGVITLALRALAVVAFGLCRLFL